MCFRGVKDGICQGRGRRKVHVSFGDSLCRHLQFSHDDETSEFSALVFEAVIVKSTFIIAHAITLV